MEEALREHARTGEFLGMILVNSGIISELALLEVLAEQFGLLVVSLKDRYIDWELVKTFSPSLVLEAKCFPLSRDKWSVTMAIVNPLDAWVIKRAEEEAFPLRLKLALTLRSDMMEVVQRYKQYIRGEITD